MVSWETDFNTEYFGYSDFHIQCTVFDYFEAFSENMYDQSSMYKMGFSC